MENRPGRRTRLYLFTELFCLLLVVGLALFYRHHRGGFAGRNAITAPADGSGLPVPREDAARLTVLLEEISLQEVDEQVRYSFLLSNSVSTESESDPDVNYPPFQSAAPLYGLARFDDRDGPSRHRHFAIDHSEGKPGAYDLLYLDEDGDCDLRNNLPRRALKDPNGLPQRYSDIDTIWFESVHVSFQFEPGNRRPVELLPRLWLYKDREPRLGFVAATAHRGEFAVDGRTYEAFLGYGYAITGQLDSAFSTLCLRCENGEYAGLFGTAMDRLGGMRSLGGQWCQFSCSPTGDQLFVYLYQGPLGVLQLGTGGRSVQRLEMFGELHMTQGRLTLGHTLENGLLQGTNRYEIPIGDYSSSHLTVRLGDMGIAFSPDSYDQEGRPIARERVARKIRIREKKPFVLDFSDKPRVVFVGPPKGSRFTVGNPLRVETVFVDRSLGVVIAGVSDMTQSERKTVTMADGRQRTIESGSLLEPKIAIARANGQIVAEGVMSLGVGGVCGYSWQVPTDLPLDGDRETFTLAVTYDTRELYGVVTAKRDFVVSRN